MMPRCPKYKGLSEGYDSAENAENILPRFPWGGRLGLVSCSAEVEYFSRIKDACLIRAGHCLRTTPAHSLAASIFGEAAIHKFGTKEIQT